MLVIEYTKSRPGRTGRRAPGFVSLTLGMWLSLTAGPVFADVLVLTQDRAIEAADARIGADGNVAAINRNRTTAATIVADQVILLRFDVGPCHTQARAWLCLHDGRRISGDSLQVGPDRVVLVSAGRPDTTVSRDELAALFFRARQPEWAPPAAGVRIISPNGDSLDAPEIELTNDGVFVDVDPDAEPIHLPPARVAGVIWPARAAGRPAKADEPARRLIELRTGESLIGRIAALDRQALLLETVDSTRTVPRREVRAIWFGRHAARPAEDQVAPARGAENDRPSYRRGSNALGSPLRIGQRAYPRGLGLRGPAAIDIPVPARARWFLAQVGADADAAPFARISLEILVDARLRWERKNVAPGEPALPVAVPVRDAASVTLRARPSGDDPTGCLGDFADAIFIIE